jgi:hypothetical protein
MRYGILLLALTLVLTGCGAPTPTLPVVNSLADVVLRAGPGPGFDEIAQIPKGAPVELIGSAPGYNCWEWVLVRTADGDEGWTMPILVNVDIEKSVLPPLPTLTPELPLPSACSADLGLLQIDNQVGKALQVYMIGAEPGFTLSIEDGETKQVCLTPGAYCYNRTDGEKHERGNLAVVEGQCTCWHWGGGQPRPGSCQCPNDPGQYERP